MLKFNIAHVTVCQEFINSGKESLRKNQAVLTSGCVGGFEVWSIAIRVA